MYSFSRSVRVVAAMVATTALLALASCSGGKAESGGDPRSDATLTIGVQVAPNSLDPAELHDGQQMYVWSAVYDTLIYSDNDAVLQPNAAESWEYSDDARTLTLTLREGMTFSTGEPVTAAAVKATLERTAATAGPQQPNLAAIESIAAPDDRTVVLNLAHPDPNLLVSLAQGAGVIGDPATLDNPRTGTDPVGSGAYVIDRGATVDGSKYVLKRRDDYWNADAYPFETVTIRVIPDRTARFNALVSGEIDAGTVDANQTAAAEGAKLNIKRVDGISLGEIIMADRTGDVVEPLSDVRVRRAINMAFDRPKMVDKVLGGYGKPTVQIFNPNGPTYVPELDETYPYDPEAARQLLAEAGHADGFSVTMPSNHMSQPWEPTITQALADIGVTVKWQPVPPQNAGQTDDYGMYFNFGSAAPPARTVAVKLAPTGSQNPFKHKTPELTALAGEAGTAIDTEQANEVYREINRYVVEDAWFAPLFWISTNWATRSGTEYLGDGRNPHSTIRAFGLTE